VNPDHHQSHLQSRHRTLPLHSIRFLCSPWLYSIVSVAVLPPPPPLLPQNPYSAQSATCSSASSSERAPADRLSHRQTSCRALSPWSGRDRTLWCPRSWPCSPTCTIRQRGGGYLVNETGGVAVEVFDDVPSLHRGLLALFFVVVHCRSMVQPKVL